MTCGIYKITNTQTGEIYVGQSPDIDGRWKCHKQAWMKRRKSYECKKLLESAITCGINSFEFEILEECSPLDLSAKEIQWMGRLKPSLNGGREKRDSFSGVSVGFMLKKVRQSRGLSQNALARKLNMTTQNVQHLENSPVLIRLDVLDRLCKTLECSPGDLFEFVKD